MNDIAIIAKERSAYVYIKPELKVWGCSKRLQIY